MAALSVIGNHTGLMEGGFVGVDGFLVISGYLISGIILRELTRRRFSILEFYARRMSRIFPGLAVVLVAVLDLAGWFHCLTNTSSSERIPLRVRHLS